MTDDKALIPKEDAGADRASVTLWVQKSGNSFALARDLFERGAAAVAPP